MTILVNRHRSRREDRVTTHAYTLPVVRELPAQPPNAIGDPTW
jgi:hypothetical protein